MEAEISQALYFQRRDDCHVLIACAQPLVNSGDLTGVVQSKLGSYKLSYT